MAGAPYPESSEVPGIIERSTTGGFRPSGGGWRKILLRAVLVCQGWKQALLGGVDVLVRHVS